MPDPLIIIGAGRSGTNALRDALCSLDDFHTWPCDEINYIWRHRNRTHPTDQFTARHATPEVTAFVRKAFQKQARRHPSAVLVEKTCANSLRVDFVNKIFPNAWFVHLIRDGRDVAASAKDRWTAPLDIPYLLAKARFVPRTDLPHYASRYLASRLAKLKSDEDRLSWWGPKFDGMVELTPATPLVEVAARQWERCVTLATDQLSVSAPERTVSLRYEYLSSDPRGALETLTRTIGRDIEPSSLDAAASTIRAGSVGKWKSALTPQEAARIEPIVAGALERLGDTP